ncbi:hypothetical protein BDV96DRAFT_295737 [Lophiotrema nucula]|uniref:Uncharacterized protein n=1 Tax=Lophiotrema nucula TaxID=690887 RepID=A0A6A5YMH7_9PLEO|nr:hypothetical protein BDV96DRAFT_295737 [Lophiotrema nucula]
MKGKTMGLLAHRGLEVDHDDTLDPPSLLVAFPSPRHINSSPWSPVIDRIFSSAFDPSPRSVKTLEPRVYKRVKNADVRHTSHTLNPAKGKIRHASEFPSTSPLREVCTTYDEGQNIVQLPYYPSRFFLDICLNCNMSAGVGGLTGQVLATAV